MRQVFSLCHLVSLSSSAIKRFGLLSEPNEMGRLKSSVSLYVRLFENLGVLDLSEPPSHVGTTLLGSPRGV